MIAMDVSAKKFYLLGRLDIKIREMMNYGILDAEYLINQSHVASVSFQKNACCILTRNQY